jgi:hypothetical protein
MLLSEQSTRISSCRIVRQNFDTGSSTTSKHADLREDPYVCPSESTWRSRYTDYVAVTGKTITLEVESSDTIGTHAL